MKRISYHGKDSDTGDNAQTEAKKEGCPSKRVRREEEYGSGSERLSPGKDSVIITVQTKRGSPKTFTKANAGR